MEQVDESKDNEIHLVEERIHPTHLTISDYEDTLAVQQVFEDVHDSFAQDDSYQIYQSEAQKKYDLRPRPTGSKQQINPNYIKSPPQNPVVQNQPKNIVDQPAVRKFAKENKEVLTVFSLKNEISKIKVPIPLLELLKNKAYKETFMKLLQPIAPFSDIINL